MQRFEQFVAELRQDHLFDELLTQLPATAVSENDFLVISYRDRTSGREERRSVHSNHILCAQGDMD